MLGKIHKKLGGGYFRGVAPFDALGNCTGFFNSLSSEYLS